MKRLLPQIRRVTFAAGCVLAAAVAQAQTPPPISPTCTVVSPSAGPPLITLTAGEFYFRDNGTPSLLPGTNPTGWQTTHFDELFGYASVNERIVRIHLNNGNVPHPTFAGEADCAWVQFWDDVFYRAEQNGLHVLPVFDAWAGWSTANAPPQNWANNIYNVANPLSACADGSVVCLAANPNELLQPGVAGGPRDTWLLWMEALVNRWQDRPNILGWEIFSELNLITGATEADAVSFVEAAAARIRATDVSGRPITASVAGNPLLVFPTLSASSLDFLQVHPYSGFPPYSGNLDQMILATISALRTTYLGKPAFIGESGLDTLLPVDKVNTLTLAEPGARTGINQAIWAGVVSGAMNTRMLWFEDGYDRYSVADLCVYAQYAAYLECADGNPATVLTLRALYAYATSPIVTFMAGLDYSNFAAVGLTVGGNVIGATLGNSSSVIGWVRDVQSAAPTWPSRLLAGETVTVDVPGVSNDWIVDFYDATTTGAFLSSVDADQDVNGDITATLPDFSGSIAFKIRAVAPLAVQIDVRPGSALNRINPSRASEVPVSILTTSVAAGDPEDFDATTIRRSTVRFGPAGAVPSRGRRVDVDGDGDIDRVFFFRENQTGFVCGDVIGTLTGETQTGRSFTGSGAVKIVPCP